GKGVPDVNTNVRARGRIAAALAIGATAGMAAVPSAVQANPLRISARRHVLEGRAVPVSGALTPAAAGRTILIQASRGHGWATVARTKTGAAGKFRAKWRPN